MAPTTTPPRLTMITPNGPTNIVTVAPTTIPPTTSPPTVAPTTSPPNTCPPLVENAVVVNGSSGQYFRVVNGQLRPITDESYAQLGKPAITTASGASLASCTTGAAYVPPVPTPNTAIRAPWVVNLVHRETWMNSAVVRVLAIRGGVPTLEDFAWKDLAQVFVVYSDGSVRNAGSLTFLANDSATTCGTARSSSDASVQWIFQNTGDHPLAYRVIARCGKALGSNPVTGATNMVQSAVNSEWFILPVGELMP